VPGLLVTLLQLETCSYSRQASDLSRLASQGVPPILETEVTTRHPAETALSLARIQSGGKLRLLYAAVAGHRIIRSTQTELDFAGVVNFVPVKARKFLKDQQESDEWR
jgi:hypothetical protein